MVLPLQPGGNLGGVAPGCLLNRQVGGDHGVPARHQAAVDELIQGGMDEGGGQLAAQVVQDRQVTVELPPGLVPGLPAVVAVPLELAGLKLGEDVAGGVIDHGKALL